MSVIFSFCNSLHTAVQVAQTCRSWRAAAVHPQSSCRATFRLSSAAFKSMLDSPLHVHLVTLTLQKVKQAPGITATDFLLLSARLPWLTALRICVDSAFSESIAEFTQTADGFTVFNAAAWPTSLRRLQLTVDPVGKGDAAAALIGIQQLLDALPLSAPLLKSVVWRCDRPA